MNAMTDIAPAFMTSFGPFEIVSDRIVEKWPRAWGFLKGALDGNMGTLSEDDLLKRLLNRQGVLVLGQQSALIFEGAGFDRVSGVIFGHCGGNLAEIREAHDVLCLYFKAKGVRMTFVTGRDGWGRALPGYEKFHVTYAKVL